MNWKAWTLATTLALGGTLYAQDGEDVAKQVDDEMAKYDTNKDGKIAKAEYRAAVKKEGDFEDEAGYAWLDKWKYSFIDFLAADTDDNLEVTKEELLAYTKRLKEGTSETAGKLTKKDISEFDNEYLEPIVKWMLDVFDTDKNGKISQKEADAQDIGDVVKEYDTNKDANLDGMEIKVSEVEALKGLYEIEEGYTLKGEPSSKETPDPNEIPESVRKDFDSVDADKDGFIGKEELKTARTQGQTNKAYWWGVYIAFLSIDTSDDLRVDIEEYAAYGRDEAAGIAHKFYPKDREEAMSEMWLDLDPDKDGKATKEEFTKVFPESDEFASIDADGSGDASKDEMWNSLKGQFGESFEFPEKDKETGGTTDGGTANADDPMWKHYQKVGRSWMHKNASKYMGIENTSYIKYEVMKVAADHCVVKMTMLDHEKKPMAGMAPTETKIEFKSMKAGPNAANPPKVKDLGVEKLKVEAGEFECQVTETVTEIAGVTYTTKAWMHKQYPGLGVKTETISKDMTSSSELVEFNE